MTKEEQPPPRLPLLRGAARGVVAAMAMSGMRQVAMGVGAIRRTPPDAILREGVPFVLRRVPEHRRTAFVEFAHWGYGAAAGAVFGLLGAALVVSVRRGYDVGWLLGLLGINVAFTFLAPNISWQGHVGGFLGGLAITAIIVYSPRGPRRSVIQWSGVAAVAVVVLLAIAARIAVLA